MSFPPLEHELFCDMYYLRNLCDISKFPDWPVISPLQLLKEVLYAWKLEVEKKPQSMTMNDALNILGIPGGSDFEESKVRKAYFKMAQQYHPDKNPNGRDMFEKVNTAYEFLCSQSSKGGSDGSPDANNIVLILRTQSILFGRYSKVNKSSCPDLKYHAIRYYTGFYLFSSPGSSSLQIRRLSDVDQDD